MDCSEGNGAGGACLFDMRVDATEHVNVAAQQPAVVASLKVIYGRGRPCGLVRPLGSPLSPPCLLSARRAWRRGHRRSTRTTRPLSVAVTPASPSSTRAPATRVGTNTGATLGLTVYDLARRGAKKVQWKVEAGAPYL